jgi:carboxyl-terminal processing protease
MRTILLLYFIGCPFFAVAQQSNTNTLRQKTITLRRFLEQNHYQPLQWNDSASLRLYSHWMELLDKEKLLFSKTEIVQLKPYTAKLDEEMVGKEWDFFNKSTALYKTCLLRADSIIKATLAKPLDFSVPDILNWPLVNYPDNSNGIYKTWQQYLKWKVLHSIADVVMDSATGNSNYDKPPANFAELEIKAMAATKKQELLWVQNKLAALEQSGKEMEDTYLSAISWCYDPHTQYMNAETKTDFDTEMSGLEFSTGFQMDENEKGEWEIIYLVPGGPAWRNGELHKGDILIKIQSGDKPALMLADAGTEQLSKILEGSSNEKITITVRTASGMQKTVVLSKEKITSEESVVKSFILQGSKKIGYIDLPGFYVKEGDNDNIGGCSNDVAKEIIKLKKDSIAGLLLDLRFNGGGSLGEALELAGIFINEGPLTSIKDKTGKVHFLKDPNRGTIYDGPLLVMVNTLSASASELLAAVLQDYHRAIIAGSPTYGKGSAQIILPMDTSGNFSDKAKYDSYVKVTNEKFYRIDGSATQRKGVIPDIELPDAYAVDKFRESANISALQTDNSKAAFYQVLPVLPVAALKLKSAERVAAENNFKKITAFTTWYKSLDAGRNIPLQWTAYINFYKKNKEMYIALEKDSTGYGINVINNGFDAERLQLITEQGKSINQSNIKRIEKDNYIAECYKIMQDWLK